MKFFQKVFSSKDFIPLALIVIFSLLAVRTLLLPGYFPMHDDLQMMRQLQMEKCFVDGQIPCRWVPDMGYGFGFPLFNFYPPLPYLVGQGIRLFGLAFTDTAKLTFSLSLLVSGLGMYFLAKEFFGRTGGLISAVFYIWAPYHALDIYVRGAMNEAWALALFPFIFWTSYRLINEKKNVTKWAVALALSWFGLLASHNLMVLMFSPVFAVWCLLFVGQKKWNRLPHLAVSGILALGLAAFFTIPALIEQKYVQVNTLISGYYDYSGHFVSLNQMLLSRFWGYGGSIFGTGDGMAFPIGHFHWIASILVILYLFYRYRKTKKLDKFTFVVGLMVVIGWFAAFMAHSRSTFIWLRIPILAFFQFPWRFLTITTFAFSFVAGALVLVLEKKKKILFIAPALLLLSIVIWNWEFFRIERRGPVSDAEKFSGEAWRIQQTAGIYDYLPKTAKMAPQAQRQKMVDVIEGTASVEDENQGTNWAAFKANVESKKALVRIGIFYFPNWRVFVDGAEVGIFIPEGESWGRMHIELPKGSHEIYLKLYNTPVRTTSNIISLVTWVGLLTFPFWKRKVGVLKSRHGNLS